MISVTAVHSDKVPMVPNFGQQPRFIVTIQPAGARFDPPARLTLPNVDGLAPGEVTEMYSFDHDLGHFVSIGPATVSDDGDGHRLEPRRRHPQGRLALRRRPGGRGHAGGLSAVPDLRRQHLRSGLLDGGPSTASGEDLLRAIFREACTCDDNDECTINDRCDGSGGCTGDPVEVNDINGACVGAVGQPVNLTADSNAPERVSWKAPGGNPSSGQGGAFAVTYASKGDKKIKASCKQSSKSKKVTIDVSCSTIVPALKEPEKSKSPQATDFGTVFHGTRRKAKYKGCVDGGSGVSSWRSIWRSTGLA